MHEHTRAKNGVLDLCRRLTAVTEPANPGRLGGGHGSQGTGVGQFIHTSSTII
jgi:hypothetical protein